MRIETHRNHHAIHNIEWKTSWRIFAVRGAAFKNSSNNQAWSVVTRNLVQNVESSPTKRKAAMDYRETEARQCAKVERQLFCWPRWKGVQGNHQTRIKKWNFQRKPRCPVSWRRRNARSGTGKLAPNPTKSENQSMHASWKLMSPRERVWKGPYQKITKITLRRMGPNRWVILILCTSSFPCPKQWKFQRQKQRWIKNGRRWNKCQHGKWPRYRA